MGSFWQTVAAVALGGAITLVGSYLAHRWQARRESERYERERGDRLDDERRARQGAVAAEVWQLATRCYYLIHQECQGREPGSEELGEASKALSGAVQQYLQCLEENALWIVRVEGVEEGWRRLLGAFRGFFIHFEGLSWSGEGRIWKGGEPDWAALSDAYDTVRQALGKFAGI